MKILITTMLMAAILTTTSLSALEADKKKHALVGIGIYAGCMLVGKIIDSNGYDSHLNEKTCLFPLLGAAIGKELYDKNHVGHNAEVMDAVATVVIPIGFSIVISNW